MSAHELYRNGDLSGAIAAATAAVKANPTDLDARGFLAELFCFSGDWERADRQLDAMGLQQPDWAVSLALLRQLIRAETDRAEVLSKGRAPKTIDGGEAQVAVVLETLLCLRENRPADAAAALAAAETPKVSGEVDGRAFSEFRDLDDVFASVLEVFTSTGEYYLLPLSLVHRIDFEPPTRPHHLLWRQGLIETEGGPSGDVFFPARYAALNDLDDSLLLVRATDWRPAADGVVQGVGQRTFLADEEDVPMLQINSLVFG